MKVAQLSASLTGRLYPSREAPGTSGCQILKHLYQDTWTLLADSSYDAWEIHVQEKRKIRESSGVVLAHDETNREVSNVLSRHTACFLRQSAWQKLRRSEEKLCAELTTASEGNKIPSGEKRTKQKWFIRRHGSSFQTRHRNATHRCVIWNGGLGMSFR
jgi:hypothetical protein